MAVRGLPCWLSSIAIADCILRATHVALSGYELENDSFVFNKRTRPTEENLEADNMFVLACHVPYVLSSTRLEITYGYWRG